VTGAELRERQAPLKAKYKEDPASALVVHRARATLVPDAISAMVETSPTAAGGKTRVGLHPATAGDGSEMCSGDLLLQALVGCAGVTMRAVSTAMGLNVQGDVLAEGDLDYRGTLGVSKEVPVGFAAIRLRFELASDATDEQLAKLVQLTERYCVVLQTIRAATPTSATTARR
jgi:uncharacterized OsmC-like protein